MLTMIKISIVMIFTIAIILILLLFAAHMFYTKIYTKYKRMSTPLTAKEILEISNAIIQSEISLYENDVFSNGGIIDNAQFENYYNAIVNSIIESFSEEFLLRVGYIMNVDVFIQNICRSVREYLSKKVENPDGIDEE